MLKNRPARGVKLLYVNKNYVKSLKCTLKPFL